MGFTVVDISSYDLRIGVVASFLFDHLNRIETLLTLETLLTQDWSIGLFHAVQFIRAFRDYFFGCSRWCWTGRRTAVLIYNGVIPPCKHLLSGNSMLLQSISLDPMQKLFSELGWVVKGFDPVYCLAGSWLLYNIWWNKRKLFGVIGKMCCRHSTWVDFCWDSTLIWTDFRSFFHKKYSANAKLSSIRIHFDPKWTSKVLDKILKFVRMLLGSPSQQNKSNRLNQATTYFLSRVNR